MKLILFLILTLFPATLLAPEYKVIPVLYEEGVSPYERLINAIGQVESWNRDDILNLSEQAMGRFGIRPIRLVDFNNRTGKNFSHADCFDYEKSREIFMFYASQHNPDDILSICRGWNGASSKNKYYRKVLKQLNKVKS